MFFFRNTYKTEQGAWDQRDSDEFRCDLQGYLVEHGGSKLEHTCLGDLVKKQCQNTVEVEWEEQCLLIRDIVNIVHVSGSQPALNIPSLLGPKLFFVTGSLPSNSDLRTHPGRSNTHRAFLLSFMIWLSAGSTLLITLGSAFPKWFHTASKKVNGYDTEWSRAYTRTVLGS